MKKILRACPIRNLCTYSRNGDVVARKVCEAVPDALGIQVRSQIQSQEIQPGGKGTVSSTNNK